MKNLLILLITLVLGIGIGYLLFNNFHPSEPQIIYKDTIIKGDSIPYEVRVEIPVPIDSIIYLDSIVYLDSIIYDTITKQKRFEELLKNYTSITYYNDTLKNDTSAFIFLKESIQFNKIKDRELIFANVRSIKIENVIKKEPFKLGIGIIGGKENFSPSVMFIDRKRNFTYQAGYNLINNGVNIGVFYNFNFRK